MAQDSPELERAKRLIRELDKRTTDSGCTEAEAVEAASKVGELLERFDLQLSDVFVREEKCRKVEVYASDTMAQSFVTGIGRLCGLKTYHVGGSTPITFVMFGMERDIELGLYLYEVLNEAVNVEWSRTVMDGHGFKRASRDSFRTGFGGRMYSRLYKLAEHREAEHRARQKASSCTDLVLVRERIVEEEFEKTGVKLVNGARKRIHDVAAFHRGQAAAEKVNINSPLEGDRRESLA